MVAEAAEPVRLSWQMTATPMAGTSSSRHLFRPGDGDRLAALADQPGENRVRMRIPFPAPARPSPTPARPDSHATVTVSQNET
jgi:hypothetical protein